MQKGLLKLLENLRTVYKWDDGAWQSAKASIIRKNTGRIFWYAGFGRDRGRYYKEKSETKNHNQISNILKNLISINTDYSMFAWKNLFARYYQQLSAGQRTVWQSHLEQTLSFGANYFQEIITDKEFDKNSELVYIPLKLFSEEQRKNINNRYKECYHKSMTDAVITPTDCHIMCVCKKNNPNSELKFLSFYVYIENLTFWKEVAEKFELYIDVFCAYKLGGKSGSWDHTHDIERGHLMRQIASSNNHRPQLWLSDESLLPKEWKEIFTRPRGGGYQIYYYLTDWDNLLSKYKDERRQ